MKIRNKRLALIEGLLLIILEIIGFIYALTRHGFMVLGFYTQQSNLILLIAASVYVVSVIKHYEEDEISLPLWVSRFKYYATCLVFETFTIVIFVLVPMMIPEGRAFEILFTGSNLYHHILCPLIAVASFCFLAKGLVFDFKIYIKALVPTIIYAIVTTTLNIAKVIRGPYPFLYVYEQPVWVSVLWFFVIPLCALLLAVLLGVLHKKTSNAFR